MAKGDGARPAAAQKRVRKPKPAAPVDDPDAGKTATSVDGEEIVMPWGVPAALVARAARRKKPKKVVEVDDPVDDSGEDA